MAARKKAEENFETSVFVNCPFDSQYRALFRPLIFTIHSLGFQPRVALERVDCGEVRFTKILELIQSCRWSIHDLSRCKALKKGEYYRMNMPLELGVDFGAKHYGSKRLRTKRFLILEEERFRFQQAVSDLAGYDIKAHNNEPANVVKAVKNWLVQEAGAPDFPPSVIWNRFNDFIADTHKELTEKGYSAKDIEELPEDNLSKRMAKWIGANPMKGAGTGA